jgi:hypothetical protein
MGDLKFASLGQAWVNLVHRTLHSGGRMGAEGYELLGVEVGFAADAGPDAIVEKFGDRVMIAEMQRVFFSDGSEALGHSYRRQMRGPGGGPGLEEVIGLLGREPLTKRAVMTLGGSNGKVPCINVVHFLVREDRVLTTYFARGQDAFGKFYADGLCLGQMARTVGEALKLKAGQVTGYIASSHVYDRDLPAVEAFLAQTREFLRNGASIGGG